MSNESLPENPVLHCSFCGKKRHEVGKLIVANDAGICDNCITLCANILSVEKNQELKKEKNFNLDPVRIKEYLDQHVIGQDIAKVTLCVSVVNHYKRIYFKSECEIEKSNILMFGTTGSGKTLLARKIADYLDVPFVIADATTLTEAGYRGDDVESLIAMLLAEADYDIEKCEKGIVFIDEIDKIAKRSETLSVHDVGGEGVQQALLKLVEGTKCKVKVGNSRKTAAGDTVEVNTSNILFIAAGAFAELDKIINNRTNSTSIGFTGSPNRKDVDRTKFRQEDFIKFGLIPEFVGRFPIITYVEPLNLDALKRILVEPKNNLIKQMQFYFDIDDIKLTFEDDAIAAIAEHALEMQCGARSIRSILENILQSFLFDIETIKQSDHQTLVITKDIVWEKINKA